MEDVSGLFEIHTVKEIQEIEKKTRALIERRKEDLRQMVGERYRDLLEAADTIAELKTTVENVTTHIKIIEKLSVGLNISRSEVQLVKVNDKDISRAKLIFFYQVAAQAKLLLEVPEKVWQYIEIQDFLSAARLLLLSHYVYSNIEMQILGNQSGNILADILPLIHNQLPVLNHLKSVILEKADLFVKTSVYNSEQVMAETLCAILLLKDTTPRQVFADFLLGRMNAIQDALHPSKQGHSVKNQTTLLVKLLQDSLFLVDVLFYPVSDNGQEQQGLLVNVFKNVLQESVYKSLLMNLKSVIFQNLPNNIIEFCPVMKTVAAAVSIEYLKENCKHWLDMISQNLTSGVGHLLNYINTIRSLTAVKEAVISAVILEKYSRNWQNVCSHLLQSEFLIWSNLFSPIFIKRAQNIIQINLDQAFVSVRQSVEQALHDGFSSQSDSTNFVWSESPSDIPEHINWGSNKPVNKEGNLMMKVRGFTPRIQNLCCNFDNKLKLILEDAGQYLINNSNSHESNQSSEIQSYISSSYTEGINKLLDFERSIMEEVSKKENYSLHLVLLVARLSMALGEICPHLEIGIEGLVCQLDTSDNLNPSTEEATLIIKSAKRNLENSSWMKMKSTLQEQSLQLFRVWTKSLLEEFRNKCKTLLASNSSDAIRNFSQWDNIEINEESEDGTVVKSSISIPMHPSTNMMNALHCACVSLNKVGGHTIPRTILQEIHSSLINEILSSYEEFIQTSSAECRTIYQCYSLQSLFDLRFVSGLMDSRSAQNRIHAICDQLESFVDPFDLDVFSPYMQNHLRRCIKRCSVILGLLTNPDKAITFVAGGTTAGPSSSKQEQHIVMPLSLGGQFRFTLLPITSSFAKSYSDISKESTLSGVSKVQKAISKSEKSKELYPRSVSPEPAGFSKSVTSSFFGAMSSSWFGS